MRIITNLISWLKGRIRDQLGFSHAEMNGMLVLLLLITCLLAAPSVIKWYDQKYNLPTYDTDVALLNSTLAWLQEQQAKSNVSSKIHTPPPTKIPKQSRTHASFDLNTATAQKLQTLTGIGPTRAARIIKYRDKLGGFVREEQYREIYGLDAVALHSLLRYTYIAPNFQPTKLRINEDDFRTLVHHPYLSYDQVKQIVRSREKHGRFNDIEELLQKGILDKDTYEKVKAYLVI